MHAIAFTAPKGGTAETTPAASCDLADAALRDDAAAVDPGRTGARSLPPGAFRSRGLSRGKPADEIHALR